MKILVSENGVDWHEREFVSEENERVLVRHVGHGTGGKNEIQNVVLVEFPFWRPLQ